MRELLFFLMGLSTGGLVGCPATIKYDSIINKHTPNNRSYLKTYLMKKHTKI